MTGELGTVLNCPEVIGLSAEPQGGSINAVSVVPSLPS